MRGFSTSRGHAAAQCVAISPPNPGTGPSAALRVVAASDSDSGLAAGCVAGASSRGGRRGARCGPVVRLLQRAVFLEVGEDGANGLGVFDAGDDPHRAAAVGAGGDVDGKDPLEPLRPAHRTALRSGCAARRGRLRPLAPHRPQAACRAPRASAARAGLHSGETPWKG